MVVVYLITLAGNCWMTVKLVYASTYMLCVIAIFVCLTAKINVGSCPLVISKQKLSNLHFPVQDLHDACLLKGMQITRVGQLDFL